MPYSTWLFIVFLFPTSLLAQTQVYRIDPLLIENSFIQMIEEENLGIPPLSDTLQVGIDSAILDFQKAIVSFQRRAGDMAPKQQQVRQQQLKQWQERFECVEMMSDSLIADHQQSLKDYVVEQINQELGQILPEQASTIVIDQAMVVYHSNDIEDLTESILQRIKARRSSHLLFAEAELQLTQQKIQHLLPAIKSNPGDSAVKLSCESSHPND